MKKEKIYKSFIYFVFTVCCAYFLLACIDPIKPPSPQEAIGGEGTFSLVTNGLGRTIMPATAQSNFAAYTLVFSSSGRDSVTVERINSNLTDPVTLAAAAWNLTVTAYIDSGKNQPAAQGSLDNIVINDGANVSRSLELKPIIESGAKGTFSWNIGYPTEVTVANMKISPLDASGTPEQTLYLKGGAPIASSPISLNTGYYQIVFSLRNGAHNTGREEYLHIYKNMDSRFEYTFTQEHFTVYSVTNDYDSGPGSLRHAIDNVANNSTILIENNVKTILLRDTLLIGKNLTIAGNGVTITRDPSWTTIDNDSQLMVIWNSATVTISRVHFKDGMASSESAIGIFPGFPGSVVNLESCIFSGNQSENYGAIYNAGTLSVKGCTFYGNSADYGGAITNYSNLTLTGNLFYGNKANYYPVVFDYYPRTVTSTGYNVVDVPLGIAFSQSGWAPHATDKSISTIPISPVNFKLLSGSGARNIITSRPSGYPTVDFYGNPIPQTNAAAGAIQSTASGGYVIELSVNNSALGSAVITSAPTPNADGLYSGGSVTLTATPTGPAGFFQYWMVNNNQYTTNPLTLTLNNHYKVQAVFGRNYANSVQRVSFSGSTATVNLTGLYGNDIYLVKVNTSANIVSAANTGGSSGSSLSVASNNVLPAPDDAPKVRMGHPAADVYHANPPPFERKIKKRSEGFLTSFVASTVGSTKQFWVETNLDSEIWIQKTATLVKQGSYGNIWVIDNIINSTQAQNLADKFDIIYPAETSLLGYEYGGGPGGDGGWDSDTRIQILVYDIGYNPSGTTLGYFWAKDMMTDTGSGYRSNEAEMFYLNGNTAVYANFGADQLYSTLIHEFQHMINYSQKNSKGLSSATWYNEMLSMATEDVISPLIGINSSNSGHPIKGRIPRFLTNYYLAGITEWGPNDNTLDSYAIDYAFGAYLLRNYGGASLLKEMLTNNSTDIASVTAALRTVNSNSGLSFEEAVRRFGEAMIFSGSTMPAEVQSFNKTVEKTIGSYTYTAAGFNVWGSFNPASPKIFGINEQQELRPYSLTVHQAASGWTGQNGTKSITLQRPTDSNVEFYLMVK